MRLTITPEELLAGSSKQVGSHERMFTLRHLSMRKEPISIHPVAMDGDPRKIAVVHLTEEAFGDGKTRLILKFRPVWCKTFTLCSMHSKTVKALICEMDFGTFFIDADGYRAQKYTTAGFGCDPSVVEYSEMVLGDMLAEDKRSHILTNAITLIQKSPSMQKAGLI